MTFQPPPPPSQGPPPPPQGPPPQGPPPQGPPPQGPPPPPQGPPPGGPPGQWGGPPGGAGRPGGGFDPKTVNQLDWGILGAGVLAFIFSFVSYYTASITVAGYGSSSGSESAWHGFFGWFAALLAVVGSAAIAMELFQPQVKLPFPNRLIGLGAYALATICVILALFIFPEDVPAGIDTGRGIGYWISLIVIIAGLVLSFMRFQQTGGQLPIGGNKPGGPGQSQPPAPGYGPPR